ncbi:MAG: hypothetical protein GDA56_28935 [Hormoscilla sp. GM7CHS1pb]|nr:hypothetical protein [Hormoscilla sp. GM7CHS1pb]
MLSAQCDTRRLGSGALAIAHVADGQLPPLSLGRDRYASDRASRWGLDQ